MAINYKIVKRKNPLKKDDEGLFYLNAKSLGCMNDEDFIKDLVQNTSMTKEEAAAAFSYMVKSLFKFLSLGFTVRLGKLGYFKITIKSKGSKIKEEVSKDKIQKILLNFIPHKETAHIISDLPVERFGAKR